jgi:hypothetical protein
MDSTRGDVFFMVVRSWGLLETYNAPSVDPVFGMYSFESQNQLSGFGAERKRRGEGKEKSSCKSVGILIYLFLQFEFS